MAKNGQKSNDIGDQVAKYLDGNLTRHDFPSDFIWGAATACYQVEGAYAVGNKSMSNWDVFSLQRPGKIEGGSNGCVATDHYHRFRDDVALMKKLGLDTYRFSLSWSRILPAGRLSGGVNREGIDFYNCLIDLLVSEGIKPCVSIFHFDLPQCLEDEYGGFLDSRIIQDFAEYAQVCFFEFGDRVKMWITENEPSTYTVKGYVSADFPPAHGSVSATPVNFFNLGQAVKHRSAIGVDQTIYGGNAGTEPYIVAHNLLLAHATAVDIYRREFQAVQGGIIGVTNVTSWFEPFTETKEDIDAASRALEFTWGWFVTPIVTGDYPPVMKELVKERLPAFTPEQSKLLKGSFDFIGMNYYTSNWAQNNPTPPGTPPTYLTDQEVTLWTERDGIPIGEPTASTWLFIVPEGLYKLLMYTKEKYNDPIIYITENGVSDANIPSLTITEARRDPIRTKYYREHFAYMKGAMDQGVKLMGYYAWSLLDNYEWAQGYTVRFGFFYVDFINNLNRYPKESVTWFMNFLNKNILPRPKREVVEEIEDIVVPKKRKAR